MGGTDRGAGCGPARRQAPLSADFLRAAAPSYLASQQQAEAPGNWFEQALAYATGKLHGAAAALSPAGAGMGQVAGYTVADYLIQHASRERRYVRLPASTWDVILIHIHDPADAARLGNSAGNRLLDCYAIPLYSRAADAGDGNAAARLAGLLAEHGDLDELRARADAGDGYAAWELRRLPAAGAVHHRQRRPVYDHPPAGGAAARRPRAGPYAGVQAGLPGPVDDRTGHRLDRHPERPPHPAPLYRHREERRLAARPVAPSTCGPW